MSDLLVRVVTIDGIKEHPNADKLEIAQAGGWDIVAGKGNYNIGDTVVHVPPDAMVPRELAEGWCVDKYLAFKKNSDMGRVKAARLRGMVSFGFLAPNDTSSEIGTDLREYYGIEKWEPPSRGGAGQMRRQHPLFHGYTNIQNLRNYRDKLEYSEPLVATEKIHGTNSRVGWVRNDDSEYEFVIGTHRTQRDPENCGMYGVPVILHSEELKKLFQWAQNALDGDRLDSLIVFGEIFGAGVQDLHYGAKSEKGYRVFDIAINGEYMGYMACRDVCEMMGLPMVPVVAQGLISFDDLCSLAEGDTLFSDGHVREGIVVRPMVMENTWGKGSRDPNPKRMILKVIGGSYLTRKNGTDYNE